LWIEGRAQRVCLFEGSLFIGEDDEPVKSNRIDAVLQHREQKFDREELMESKTPPVELPGEREKSLMLQR